VTDTGELLYQAILDNPDADDPRLQYADWLQENDTSLPFYADLRAWFIRWQINGDTRGKATMDGRIPYNLGWFVDKRHLWSADRLSKLVYDAGGTGPGTPRYGSYSWNNEKDHVYAETGDCRTVYRRGFFEEVHLPATKFLGGPCESCSGIGDDGGRAEKYEECKRCYGTGDSKGLARDLFLSYPISRVVLTDRRPRPVFFPANRETRYVWDADTDDRESPSTLPAALWESVRSHETVADAVDWLSARCVAHGRRRAKEAR
jgi:uncharacterized protein (TIGR02996 family)